MSNYWPQDADSPPTVNPYNGIFMDPPQEPQWADSLDNHFRIRYLYIQPVVPYRSEVHPTPTHKRQRTTPVHCLSLALGYTGPLNYFTGVSIVACSAFTAMPGVLVLVPVYR